MDEFWTFYIKYTKGVKSGDVEDSMSKLKIR